MIFIMNDNHIPYATTHYAMFIFSHHWNHKPYVKTQAMYGPFPNTAHHEWNTSVA